MIAPPDDVMRHLQKTCGDAPVALIGCRSSGETYPPCEYDILVIRETEPGLQRTVVNQTTIDTLILDTKTIRKALYGRIALIQSKPLIDPSFAFPSLRETLGTERLRESFRQLVEEELFRSLAEIARGEEALSEGDSASADFWLELAACHFSLARVGASSHVPRPSHLATQFRKLTEIVALEDFALWTDALSANLATTTSVSRRLEALSRAYPLIWTLSREQQTAGIVTPIKLSGEPGMAMRLAEARCRHLVASHAILDAYASISFEMLCALEAFQSARAASHKIPPRHSAIIRELGRSDQADLVPLIGLNADARAASTNLARLKTRVKALLRDEAKANNKMPPRSTRV